VFEFVGLALSGTEMDWITYFLRDILDPQFPSVSMVNWTTGEGTARYWVLRLLLDTFQPGDSFVESELQPKSSQVFCAELDLSIGTASLNCTDPNAKINEIQFAAYGLPTGSCGNFSHNPMCDAKNVTSYVTKQCLGQQNCSIVAWPTFGDPCFDQQKRLALQATCSGSQGGFGTPPPDAPVYILGAIDVKTSGRKILIANKRNRIAYLKIDGIMGSTIISTCR